jgi:hypothetical protein
MDTSILVSTEFAERHAWRFLIDRSAEDVEGGVVVMCVCGCVWVCENET